jgi:Ala-tRNA(Pro) deacylase
MDESPLLELFAQYHIAYDLHQHESVFTVEEASHVTHRIPGAHSKNLFLRNKKKSYYCLISVIENKQVDLKSLSEKLGHGALSFCSEHCLKEKLHVLPGSVTPYGLIHDTDKTVTFILDEDFLKSDKVNFHPLRNDMTVSLSTKEFTRFFNLMDITVHSFHIPQKAS